MKNPRPEEALYILSEWIWVSAMIRLPRMKLSVTNKNGKVVINDKTINSLRVHVFVPGLWYTLTGVQ